MAVLGSGVLTEVGHGLLDLAAVPEPVAAFFERYNRGEPVAIALAVLVAPVVEEVLFRGLSLRALLSSGPRFALFLSAVIFAAGHLIAVQGLTALWMGLLFGWVYVRTGSLLVCVAGHVLWNAPWWLADQLGNPIPGYTLADLGGPFPRQPLAWLLVGAVALSVGVVGLRTARARVVAVAPVDPA